MRHGVSARAATARVRWTTRRATVGAAARGWAAAPALTTVRTQVAPTIFARLDVARSHHRFQLLYVPLVVGLRKLLDGGDVAEDLPPRMGADVNLPQRAGRMRRATGFRSTLEPILMPNMAFVNLRIHGTCGTQGRKKQPTIGSAKSGEEMHVHSG